LEKNEAKQIGSLIESFQIRIKHLISDQLHLNDHDREEWVKINSIWQNFVLKYPKYQENYPPPPPTGLNSNLQSEFKNKQNIWINIHDLTNIFKKT
jgi:hypothetical protein